MKRNVSFSRWIAALIALVLMVGLAWAGSQLYGLAVIAAPLIIVLAWWLMGQLPLWGVVLIAGATGAAMSAVLEPVPGNFFGGALVCGLLMPRFAKRRPSEDDWFYLAPLMFAGCVALLAGLETLARHQTVWYEFWRVLENAVRRARALNAAGLGGRQLLPVEVARWRAGQDMLEWRLCGLCGGMALSLAFFLLLGPMRKALEPVRLPGEGFVRFQTKEGYLLFFIAGLAALSAGFYDPTHLLGCLGYVLLFWGGTGFFLQAIAIGAWYLWRVELPFAIPLACAGAVLALLVSPILAAPIALVGLADVWLDFRQLD